MTNSSEQTNTAQRKQLLLAQSALYRAHISNGKHAVTNGLRTESLVQSAVAQLGQAAFAALKNRSGLSANGLPAIAPLILRGAAILSAKNLLKPVLRGALIAGSVAIVVGITLSKKRKASAAAQDNAR